MSKSKSKNKSKYSCPYGRRPISTCPVYTRLMNIIKDNDKFIKSLNRDNEKLRREKEKLLIGRQVDGKRTNRRTSSSNRNVR